MGPRPQWLLHNGLLWHASYEHGATHEWEHVQTPIIWDPDIPLISKSLRGIDEKCLCGPFQQSYKLMMPLSRER